MLKIASVSKKYNAKSFEVNALDSISLEFENNGLVFITGPSGSGKTTLLNILGGLDIPTKGTVSIDDKILGKDLSLEKYRENYVGFVFQEYNLLDSLSVYDNIAISVSKLNKASISEVVKKVLNDVELAGYENRKINELSGGQKQRVAIARALAKSSKVLLCDEPTGNLDSKTSEEIFKLLKAIAKEKLVIVVSHNDKMASDFADRLIKICDGKIEENILYNDKLDDVVECKNEVNRISFKYKMKLALSSLFYKKFKTIISFMLIFLSLISFCTVQISMSYNSEINITKTLTDKDSFIVLENNSTSDASNSQESRVISSNINEYLTDSQYRKGYRTIFGTIFVLNDDLKEKEFYCKKELSNNSVYITDYYIDLIINLNEVYEALAYENYEELLGKSIYKNGELLFNIAGIIKTDYKNYFDERNNVKNDSLDLYADERIYEKVVKYNLNYKYNVLYMNTNLFNKLNLSLNSVHYLKDNKNEINITESNYNLNVSNILIRDLNRNTYLYYDNSGFIKTTDVNTKGIVINGSLYNSLFGTNIDWSSFAREYQYGIDSDNPYVNKLSNLGKKITINVLDSKGNIIINRQSLEIIGVDYEGGFDKDNNYVICASFLELGIKNIDLASNYATEIVLIDMDNKLSILNELREDSLLVAGYEATLIYEKEYIIKQMSYFFIGISIVFIIITLISIINLVSNKIQDKQKEIGILMGIGLRKKDICLIYVIPMIIIGFSSMLLTIIFSYAETSIVNSLLMTKGFENIMYFHVNMLTILFVLICTIIIVLFSLIPILIYLNKKPIEVIRKSL